MVAVPRKPRVDLVSRREAFSGRHQKILLDGPTDRSALFWAVCRERSITPIDVIRGTKSRGGQRLCKSLRMRGVFISMLLVPVVIGINDATGGSG